MGYKPKVYLTSNVFTGQEIGSNERITHSIKDKIKNLNAKLNEISILKHFMGRFPSSDQIKEEIEGFNPDLLGCHLSHPILSDVLENSNIFGVSTSTAGYNHIQRTKSDDILITHTPGVLHETVADYTVALILANLRNLIDLHNYVWNDNWLPEDKWDLDQSLSSVIDNKVLGIVGLGEIGAEVVKRLYPWGLRIIYYDKNRGLHIEECYPKLECKENLQEIFREADIISLHIPLNKSTEKIINKDLLKLMKKDSLLINTARGGVIDINDLLSLLEKKEIRINFSFDVYPQEPIDAETLERFKKIKSEQPEIRMIFMPHNASADADTRGRMVILLLEDLIKIIESSEIDDLNDVHLIPEHKKILFDEKWRIYKYWNNKLK